MFSLPDFKKLFDETGANSPAKAAFWFTVCGVIQRALGLIIVPVYTRIMSEGDYGIYSLGQSWYYIVTIFVALNLDEYVFQNGMMKYSEDRDGYCTAMLGLSTLSTLAWIIVFLLFPGFWSNLFGFSAPIVFFILLRCLITPCYGYWAAHQRFEYKYKRLIALTIAVVVATPVISIPAILFSDNKAEVALAAQVAVLAVSYFPILASTLKKSRKLFSKEYWLFALRFNIPLLPHFLSLMVLQHVGRLMVASYIGNEAAAVFSVSYSAAMVVTIVNNSVVQTLVPWTYKHIKDGAPEAINGVGVACLALDGAACFCLAAFAPEAIAILAPESYSEAAQLIPPMCASVVLQFVFNLFANIEYYFEETKPIAAVSIVAALANVLINMVFIPRFGMIGASCGMLASYGLNAVLHYYLMRRAIKRHSPGLRVYRVGQIVLVAIGCVAAVLMVGNLYPLPVVRYVILAIFAIAAFWKREEILKLVRRPR